MPQKSETAVTRDKRGKFVKLAQNRTRNAIKSIRIIGKLGNFPETKFAGKKLLVIFCSYRIAFTGG